MTKLKLKYRTYTQNLGGSSPDDKWSRDSTKSEYYCESLTITDEYFTDVVPFDVNIGDVLYAVIAKYTTGDTFGSDTAEPEHIATFKTKIEALDLINQINECKKGKDYLAPRRRVS